MCEQRTWTVCCFLLGPKPVTLESRRPWCLTSTKKNDTGVRRKPDASGANQPTDSAPSHQRREAENLKCPALILGSEQRGYARVRPAKQASAAGGRTNLETTDKPSLFLHGFLGSMRLQGDVQMGVPGFVQVHVSRLVRIGSVSIRGSSPFEYWIDTMPRS